MSKYIYTVARHYPVYEAVFLFGLFVHVYVLCLQRRVTLVATVWNGLPDAWNAHLRCTNVINILLTSSCLVLELNLFVLFLIFQRDPRLHHHPSGGPSMSPEIARSATLSRDLGPLPVRLWLFLRLLFNFPFQSRAFCPEMLKPSLSPGD